MKTNATRILDKLGIAYETCSYPVDPDDLGAEKVAQGVGLPIERVFKTLVARGDKHGILLAVVPGDVEVDLKSLARLSDNKRVDMVHLKRGAALDRLHSRRSYRPGLQKRLSGVCGYKHGTVRQRLPCRRACADCK